MTRGTELIPGNAYLLMFGPSCQNPACRTSTPFVSAAPEQELLISIFSKGSPCHIWVAYWFGSIMLSSPSLPIHLKFCSPLLEIRHKPLDTGPEAWSMTSKLQMTQLMNNNIIDAFLRCLDKQKIHGDPAGRRAAAPSALHLPYPELGRRRAFPYHFCVPAA